jgi:hypothetical protein
MDTIKIDLKILYVILQSFKLLLKDFKINHLNTSPN